MTSSTLAGATVDTPVGRVCVWSDAEAIVGLEWCEKYRTADSALLREAIAQLGAYFDGRRHTFDLPLKPPGSRFQQQVYAALCAIPYGETRSYAELARSLNTAAQPVGQACGANPIAVIIPCHRVLGSDGVGGFSAPGGIETKIALLKHENAFPYLL